MKVLVVYYSRTGTTKKAAETIAAALHNAGVTDVDIERIGAPGERKGMLGWLRAGRDATLKRATAIDPVKADLPSYDRVVIGTPIWAFTCATPVRTFCEQHGRDARQVAFFCTMGGGGDQGAFREMEVLCGRAPVATLALRERHVKQDDQGKFLDRAKEFGETIVSTAPGKPPDKP